MFADTASFLSAFAAIHRRTLRDIRALPPQAARWQPPRGEGEAAWGIGQLVVHIGASRLYFLSAYSGRGWVYPEPVVDRSDQAAWLSYLEATAEQFQAAMTETPPQWLERRIAMIDTPGTLSGGRLLLMMLEHEVHHRSQIDTYAGLEGWSVPQIFDRHYETIVAQRDEQLRGRPA